MKHEMGVEGGESDMAIGMLSDNTHVGATRRIYCTDSFTVLRFLFATALNVSSELFAGIAGEEEADRHAHEHRHCSLGTSEHNCVCSK